MQYLRTNRFKIILSTAIITLCYYYKRNKTLPFITSFLKALKYTKQNKKKSAFVTTTAIIGIGAIYYYYSHYTSNNTSITPRYPPQSIDTGNSIFNYDEVLEPNHTICASLNECTSLEHIISALKFYNSLNLKNISDQDKLTEFCCSKHQNIIDDFNHIILNHNDDTETIYNLFANDDNKCNLATCLSFKRCNRNREKDNNAVGEFIFWRDLLDQAHCYLFHLFDSGLRVKKDCFNTESKYDESCNVAVNLLSKHISKQKQNLEQNNIKIERHKSSKYNIKVNRYQNVNNDNVVNVVKEEKKEEDVSSFSIGYTFYYWPYYKKKKKIKQEWYNENVSQLGYSFKDLFIDKKYDSLKFELLNNKIHCIKLSKYDFIYHKAEKYKNSEAVKTLKADCVDGTLHYDIDEGIAFTLPHILSILFYTDFNELSTAFSSTFRPKYLHDSLSSIKARNAEYWNWSKLIRESVQYFGNKLGRQKGEPFYCGLSFMMIPSFVMRLCAPTSTSKQLEVAYNFADENGIVIQMNNGSNLHSQFLKYFNCSFLSCFNEEDERLFCGGDYPLRLESVILVSTKQNLYWFFKPLFFLDCMLSGIQLSSGEKENIKKADKKILQKLINYKLYQKKNKFLKYINDTFITFCDHKKRIVINLQYINNYFTLFKHILFDSNRLKMDLISRLFGKCRKIIIYDFYGKLSFDLFKFISSIIKIIELSTNNIEQIEIKVYRPRDKCSWLYFAYKDHDFEQEFKSQKYTIKMKRQSRDGSWDVLTIQQVDSL